MIAIIVSTVIYSSSIVYGQVPKVFPLSQLVDDQLTPQVTPNSIPRLKIEKWSVGEPQKKADDEGEVVCRIPFEVNAQFEARPGEVLTWNKGRKVPVGSGGKFILKFLLTKPETRLLWELKGPQGQVLKQESLIQIPKWEKDCVLAAGEKNAVKQFRRFMDLGLGVTAMGVQDNAYHPVTEIALTPKIAFFVPFKKPRWDLGANFFINALPLYRSDVTFRFLGANGRFGVVLPWKKTAWKIKLLVGFYYLTMLVDGNNFGFLNVMGPQIYPAFNYTFSKEKTLAFYFKFSPISSGTGFLSAASREIAAGFSYSMPAKWGKRPVLGATLDFSSVNLVVSDRTVNSQSLTLGASLRI